MRYLGVRERLSPLNMETSKANIHSGLLSGGSSEDIGDDNDDGDDKDNDDGEDNDDFDTK